MFDADSVPEHDALEKLLAFFEGLPPSDQERVCFLACRLENAEGEVRHRPMRFTDSAIAPVEAEGGLLQGATTSFGPARCSECVRSPGSAYRRRTTSSMSAEVEYGYRARRLGLASYVVNGALTQQDVGRAPGVVVTRTLKIGRLDLAFREVSAIRTYYALRNWLYFWLYQCRPLRPRGIISSIVSVLLFPTNFVLEPVSHRRQLIAYFRGVWDGLTGHMERRY